MFSGENFLHDVAVDIRESSANTVVTEGESFVIEAMEVQNGGVEVGSGCASGLSLPRPFIALAVSAARVDCLHPRTRRRRFRRCVVIAALGLALGVGILPDVEPVPRPVFAMAWAGEKPIEEGVDGRPGRCAGNGRFLGERRDHRMGVPASAGLTRPRPRSRMRKRFNWQREAGTGWENTAEAGV